MFAKHSFDVKHLFEILIKTAYTPVSVTPQEHSGTMTAILVNPANPPSVRQRAPVVQPAEVYRRRRLVVLAVVLSAFVGLWSFGRAAQPDTTQQIRSPDAVVVVVQPGDTLWTIATWLDPGSDPRPLVDALRGITGSSTLLVGQELVIPSDLLQ